MEKEKKKRAEDPSFKKLPRIKNIEKGLFRNTIGEELDGKYYKLVANQDFYFEPLSKYIKKGDTIFIADSD